MSGPASRRGFLRGLTTLPLIGGGVTLIGAPSAVAEPVTPALLDSYDAWLFYERWRLLQEKHGRYCAAPDFSPLRAMNGDQYDLVPAANGGFRWQMRVGLEALPSTRAALVLSAVGCDWREGER